MLELLLESRSDCVDLGDSQEMVRSSEVNQACRLEVSSIYVWSNCNDGDRGNECLQVLETSRNQLCQGFEGVVW